MPHNPRAFKLRWLPVLVALLLAVPFASALAAPGQPLAPRAATTGTQVSSTMPLPEATTAPLGAAIVLRVQGKGFDPTELWTVVQWQGGNGEWHDVEGWQGQPNSDGIVRWWVAPYNKSKSDFRWVVLAGPQRDIEVAVSKTFKLPKRPEQVVTRNAKVDKKLLPTPTPP